MNGFTFLTDQDSQHALSPIVVGSTDNPQTTAYKLHAVLSPEAQLLVIPNATPANSLNYPQTMQLLEKLLADT